ncbi:MAG: hypothetical protein U1E84_05510 [Rhodoferax sp.]
MPPVYRLRFFFDGVSGICLWSGNAATTEKFDYPIEVDSLPLPREVVEAAEPLISRYTAFAAKNFVWPPDDSLERFRVDAISFLEYLRHHLPSDFELVDESWF